MSRRGDQPAERPAAEESFLQRWARRKHAAKQESAARVAAPAQAPPMPDEPSSALEQSHACVQASAAASAAAQGAPTSANDSAPSQPPPLPPIESLTFDSDFSAFLAPHVPEELKRQALEKLLHDPRFNVMDGLDVYIDDYSTPSPLAPELVRGLAQARYIFEPPPTRVNAEGHVEDVPAEEGIHPEECTHLASSPSDALPDVAEANAQVAAPDARNAPDEPAADGRDRLDPHGREPAQDPEP